MKALDTLSRISRRSLWQEAAQKAAALAQECSAPALQAREALARVISAAPAAVYYEPETKHAVLVTSRDFPACAQAVCAAALQEKLGQAAAVCPLSLWEDPDGQYIKLAHSPTLRQLGKYLNFFHGQYPGGIPNAPSPLAAALTSGLLGAGIGYGAGALGETLLPRKWQRGRLRRTLGVLGGLAGAAPAGLWALSNARLGKPLNDNSLLNPPELSAQSALHPLAQASLHKAADDMFSPTGLHDLPPVQVDHFNQVIWGDPYVASRLPEATRGVASAALSAAQRLPGGVQPGWVTPLQMAHLTAGMGAGYLSGAAVAGTLGILTGLPPATQDRLKQTGMYAGIVQAVIPKLFGS